MITLILLTGCAAVWCGVWIAGREATRLESQLIQTRQLARELVIKDRTRLAIVKQDQMFFDENIWQVFIPREGMKLHLASTGIDFKPNNLPTAEASGALKAGIHQVELKVEEADDGWRVSVLVDMETLIQVSHDKEWNPNQGSGGGAISDQQIDFEPGKLAIFFQRVFTTDINGKRQPHPSGNGVALWIE